MRYSPGILKCFKGMYALDMKPLVHLPSHEVHREARQECTTGQAATIIEDAMNQVSDEFTYDISNIRNDCLRDDDDRCLDPSAEEVDINSQALNLVGFIHKLLGVEFHYLCVGGTTALKAVTTKLKQDCFTTCQSVYHASYLVW